MKKSIIILIALAGAALASDTTYTTTPDQFTANKNYGTTYGFAFNLSGSVWKTTSNPEGITLGEEVELTSISYIARVESSTEYRKNGYYAIVITDMDNTILGWSTNAAIGQNNELFTWTFEDLVLNTETSYKAIAYDSEAITLTKDTTFTLSSTAADNKYMMQGTNGVATYSNGTLDFDGSTTGSKSGLQYLKGDSLNINTGQTQHAPNVTFVTKAIPEPTTATLSLLALCGLAMRRRRK